MIYLDNAATTYPKPSIVKDSVKEWIDTGIGSPGRGRQGAAIKADSRLINVRKHLTKFFGVIDEFRIIFAYSGTDALNIGIKGFVEPGDHVIISSIEHNSVLRPLRHLEMNGTITLDVISCDKAGYIDIEKLWQAFTDKTKLVVISHASNVLGTVQPIQEIGAGVRERGAYLLVDAAQTAGVLNTNLNDLNADMLACAGHKGMFGLPGTGLLVVGDRIQKLESWRQGGTGYNSESEYQPINWPEKFEAGTMNMPGIISLGKGVEFIETIGIEKIMTHEHNLFEMLWEGLAKIPNVHLYGPEPDRPRVAVLSMNIDKWEPDDVADILQHNYKIQVRSGLQCSPLAHQVIGTHPEGTVRISPGYFTQPKDIRHLINAIKNISMTQVDWLF